MSSLLPGGSAGQEENCISWGAAGRPAGGAADAVQPRSESRSEAATASEGGVEGADLRGWEPSTCQPVLAPPAPLSSPRHPQPAADSALLSTPRPPRLLCWGSCAIQWRRQLQHSLSLPKLPLSAGKERTMLSWSLRSISPWRTHRGSCRQQWDALSLHRHPAGEACPSQRCSCRSGDLLLL